MTRRSAHSVRRIDDGSVVAVLHASDPTGACSAIEVLVHAASAADALRSCRAIRGLSPSFTDFSTVTDEDVETVMAGSELLWRPWGDADEARRWRSLDELIDPRRARMTS